jgi:PilZ domain
MSEPLIERRNEIRRRQLKAGRIVFNHATSVYDCVVRNVSTAGACLAVPFPKAVPSEFELRADGSNRSCEVVWCGDDRMGVKFHD